jgi:hypothetical protein
LFLTASYSILYFLGNKRLGKSMKRVMIGE